MIVARSVNDPHAAEACVRVFRSGLVVVLC
jgi:hypothetical protein